MTNRLYYTDPYCRAFEAVVRSAFVHEGRAAVTLDRSAFYPTSGGQPFDTGTLGAAAVVDTVDAGDEVVHVLSTPLPEGARVSGQVDWSRRFDHMQQHTGQHLLSAAFDRLFENPTVGFHMGADVSTIDLARDASPADAERAVDEANQIVWENRVVSIRFVSPAEAQSLQLRKDPAREGTLRVIDVSGFDLSACGGTHVERTGAIGLVAVTGSERVRGGVRLTFVCGGRAVRALRTYRDAVAGSIRVLSVLPGELPSAVERVQADARDARKQIKGLQEQLAAYEGARLVASAPDVQGVRVLVDLLTGWDAPGLKAVAAAATSTARACVVLFSDSTPMSVVVARSADVKMDANAVLRQLTERHGGRGGGKPELAQGGGLSGTAQEILSTARNLIDAALAAL
jgi:alanyl-tRNA synthetase